MTSTNTSEDFNLGRGWLNRAADALSAGQGSPPSAVHFARAAAMIGSGYVALAHAERAAASAAETSQVRQAILSLSDEPALDAAAEREKRAEAEARPHDDEPVLGDVIKCQKCGKQTRSVSRGCSVCGLGKPSSPHGEAFPSWPGVVYVVEGEETGVLYGAYAKDRAEGWIETEGRESWGSSLAVTVLAVDRG